jgi:AbrB family looped-hinge helix DNA binding protein
MPSAMVTFNGRVTLPTDVRKQLGLKTGDKIDFVEIGDGRFALCTRTTEADIDEDSGVEEEVPALAFSRAAGRVRETVQ